MPTAIHRQVDLARRGELARVIRRMPSGWAVLGDPQITHGYCLLLPDPVVPDLNALTGAARRQFLDDMASLGDAVLAATGAERINYEILAILNPPCMRTSSRATGRKILSSARSRYGCTIGRGRRPSTPRAIANW